MEQDISTTATHKHLRYSVPNKNMMKKLNQSKNRKGEVDINKHLWYNTDCKEQHDQ